MEASKEGELHIYICCRFTGYDVVVVDVSFVIITGCSGCVCSLAACFPGGRLVLAPRYE